jgi:putative Holliday junction resolvase
VKFLGIDYGMKKTGLALGDSGANVAVPLDVIPGGADTLPAILQIVAKEGIEAFVVGLAIPSEHQSDEQLVRTMAFLNALVEATGLPAYVVDEQFSSASARQVQREMGATAKEDAIAAMLILQAYFDEGPMEISDSL